MRSYIHDDRKVQDLFANIVNRLSKGSCQTETICGLLKDTCEHFNFGCGLIYETDHTGTFILKEKYAFYAHEPSIRQTLNLKEHLSSAEMNRLKKGHIFIVQSTVDESYQNVHLTELFGAQSLLLSPILVGPENKLTGLVAMFDRRHGILMNASSVKAAKTVLKLLGNYIQTRLIQQNLDYARQSLTSIMDNMGIDIYVNDFYTSEILYMNKSMAAPYGPRESLIGRKCSELLSEGQISGDDLCPSHKLLDEKGNPTRVLNWDYQRPLDDAWFRIFCAAFRWVDGRMARVISSVDITENKRNEELINRLACYDQMTGLPNRRKLLADGEKALAALERKKGLAWILFFDLDNFKEVNDSMGHQAGDDLLALIGRMMESKPKTKGRCYRLGGDEFVLYYDNVSRAFIDKILDFLLRRFQEPWVLPGGSPVCRASIGVARYPDDGGDMETLLCQADMAMYEAKKAGKGRAMFVGASSAWAPKSSRTGKTGNAGTEKKEVKNPQTPAD